MANIKQTSKISKVIKIISDILFIPFMIILIIYFIYAVDVNKKNGVPSFFGQSYVRIMSDSMEASGFNVGDVAVIKKVNLSNIKKGDNIAFYYGNETPKDFDGTWQSATEFKTGKKSFNYELYFHQVVDIKYDSEGNTWFQTQGTSNASPDSRFTRGDYVVGRYIESGMSNFLEFIASTKGLIVMVIVPCCIMLLFLSLALIDTIDKIMKAKKEKEALKAQINDFIIQRNNEESSKEILNNNIEQEDDSNKNKGV